MPTAGYTKRQYIDAGWDWAASSHTYSAPGSFAAVGAARAFVRLANTGRSSSALML